MGLELVEEVLFDEVMASMPDAAVEALVFEPVVAQVVLVSMPARQQVSKLGVIKALYVAVAAADVAVAAVELVFSL